LVLCKSKLYLKNLKQVQIKKQNARPELLGELSEAKPELLRTDREFCFLKKQNSGNPSFCEMTVSFVSLKNKTPVISRSFNHQSKNEQLIRLLSTFKKFQV
jgi:hypothetical protein